MNKTLTNMGMKIALSYLDSNPEKNMRKLMNWVDRFDRKDIMPEQRAAFRKVVEDEDNNWHKLVLSMWRDIDPGVRKTFFINFMLNNLYSGWIVQDKFRNEHKCNIPHAILMDPTSACNLKCTGCWAADYDKQHSLSFEELDSIINQGKQMGIRFYLYTGGEPLLRKNDIIKLCEKHSDSVFVAFTNGTLIDEQFADEMLRVKNFFPAISIEGFEKETDSRRGAGTYKSVIKAMELLKRKKLIFGNSVTYTGMNSELVGSEEFIDFLVKGGSKFAWFFTYIPLGADSHQDLMVSASQREFMYKQLRKFRDSKPIFTLDFWNDGEYAEGCIGGGRRYLHINAAGDIEPCAFIHYSDSNIREKTLLEALKSPLFMQYHKNQPFNNNHLRPCPLLDNPEKLVEMVNESGAKSTEILNSEEVSELCAKCGCASKEWSITAERLWVKK